MLPPDQETSAYLSEKIEADTAGIKFHYDLPPQFFRLFLDPTMSYSCHYFRSPEDTLERAAINKLELVANKLDLKPEDELLDIGCGWGSLLFYAAEKYGCQVTGITLSDQQVAFVEEEAARKGVEDRVHIYKMHANKMEFPDKSFNKIATIGAIEHIEDLGGMFADCERILSDDSDARMLVHGMTVPAAAKKRELDAWEKKSGEGEFIGKYIFPVGDFHLQNEIVGFLEESGFCTENIENITDHYVLTSWHWYRNLLAHGGDFQEKSGVSPEQYKAQLLFLAGCVERFLNNRILCYQTLVQKTFLAHSTRANAWRFEGSQGVIYPEELTESVTASLQFQITNETGAGHDVTVEIQNNQFAGIHADEPKYPGTTVQMSFQTLADIASGKRKMTDGYIGGAIDVDGDLLSVVRARKVLGELFSA